MITLRLIFIYSIISISLNLTPTTTYTSSEYLYPHPACFEYQNKPLLSVSKCLLIPATILAAVALGISYCFITITHEVDENSTHTSSLPPLQTNAIPIERESKTDTQEAIEFLIKWHNYSILKKACCPSNYILLKKDIENNRLYKIIPTFETVAIPQALKEKGCHQVNILANQSKNLASLLINNGKFVHLHFYTLHEDGTINASPELESKCPTIIKSLNLLWEIQQRHNLSHAAWKIGEEKKLTLIPWECTFLKEIITKLSEHACKGSLKDKPFCMRTIRCSAARIVAAYKEYQYQNNIAWKKLITKETLATQDVISEPDKKLFDMRAQTQAHKELHASLARSFITLGELDALYKRTEKKSEQSQLQ